MHIHQIKGVGKTSIFVGKNFKYKIIDPIDLLTVLEKAKKEDDVKEEDQPLYIDVVFPER